MTGSIIDLWDLSTFDAALLARLGEQRALLIDYYRTSRTNFLAREASDRRGHPLRIRMPATIWRLSKTSRPTWPSAPFAHGIIRA